MPRFFSYESRFSQVLFRIAYGCYLNLLWFVGCIPIVTIGASTAALYSVALKIAADEEGDVFLQFFRAFRSNFKQATIVWLILLAAGLLLGTDIYILSHLRAAATGALAVLLTLALAIVISGCIALAIVLIYIFPLIAYVENTTWAMIKNSLLIGTHYLFCTICVFVIYAAMAIAIIALFTPLIVLGVGFCAVISSYLLLPVMRAVSQKPDDSSGASDVLDAAGGSSEQDS